MGLPSPFSLGERAVAVIPAGVERIRGQVAFARFVGMKTIERGTREIRRQLESQLQPSEPPAEREQPSRSTSASLSPDIPATSAEKRAGSADALALADYDQLPAAHVVAKLASLTQPERDAIELHELDGHHRRTVLGKLAQLRQPGRSS